MLPIAARDYLRFGALRSWSLFKAMTAYPTLERLHRLEVPTLVIAGCRTRWSGLRTRLGWLSCRRWTR